MSRALVVCLLASAVARAQVDSPMVRAGVAAYQSLDYARAVRLLERAEKERLTVDELSLTLRTLGSARVVLGDEEGARKDFAKWLDVAPGAEMDRAVSPRIRRVFEEVRASRVTTPSPAPAVVPTTPSPPPTTATPRPALTEAPPREKPVYRKGWFWGVIGGVAAAALVAGLTAGLLTRDGSVVVVPR